VRGLRHLKHNKRNIVCTTVHRDDTVCTALCTAEKYIELPTQRIYGL